MSEINQEGRESMSTKEPRIAPRTEIGGYAMSIADFTKLLARYKKSIIGIAVVCAFLGFALAFFLLGTKYVATSTITVTDPSGSVATTTLTAIVKSSAERALAEYPQDDVSVEVGSGATAQMVTISIRSTSETEAIDLANSVAFAVATDVKNQFDEFEVENQEIIDEQGNRLGSKNLEDATGLSLLIQQGSDRTFSFCTFDVKEAVEADLAFLPPIAVAILGAMAGVAVLIAVLLVRSSMRMLIISEDSLRDVTGIPVKCSVSSPEDMEFLKVILRMELQHRQGPLLVLSRCTNFSERFAGELSSLELMDGETANKFPGIDSFDVAAWGDPSALFLASEAQATIVAVKEWEDNLRSLNRCLDDLNLVNAKIVALVVVENAR